jgi:hypothetical protein
MKLTQKQTHRPIDESSIFGTDYPECPHIYTHVIFDKVTKNAHYIKELLQQSVLEIWLFTCSSLKLDLYLSLCIKINSK